MPGPGSGNPRLAATGGSGGNIAEEDQKLPSLPIRLACDGKSSSSTINKIKLSVYVCVCYKYESYLKPLI